MSFSRPIKIEISDSLDIEIGRDNVNRLIQTVPGLGVRLSKLASVVLTGKCKLELERDHERCKLYYNIYFKSLETGVELYCANNVALMVKAMGLKYSHIRTTEMDAVNGQDEYDFVASLKKGNLSKGSNHVEVIASIKILPKPRSIEVIVKDF